jgi:hypothetical protein
MKYGFITKMGVVTDYMSGKPMAQITKKWGIATPKLTATLVSDIRKKGFNIPNRVNK